MTSSNLSRIKPKLRTEGRVSGNFGKNKVRAGSQMSGIGVTKAAVVKITTKEAYYQRIKEALRVARQQGDARLIDFCLEQLRDIDLKAQRPSGLWP